MEKKKVTKKQVKKTTKTTVKKTTAKKSKIKKKGFTLIELLAVIIILGILMIIAIPSVTNYINDSRKSAYVDTAKEIVSGTRNLVNEGKLGMYDTGTTYYIPAKYVNTENGLKSPYGEFKDNSAYVGVIYDGQGYKYYWISSDDAGQGIDEVTPVDKLESDNIKSDLKPEDIYDIVKTTGIGDRPNIKILNPNGGWEDFNADDNVSEEGEKIDNSIHLPAIDVLLINSSGQTKEEKSPYVIYPSKKGNLLCRVLYDNNSSYGLQLVTDNPIDTVTLGVNDPNPNVSGSGNTRAGNSYNRAVMTLNEKAMEYKDTNGIANDARSIGSLPNNKNYPDNLTGTSRNNLYWKHNSSYYHYSGMSSFNNKYFDSDNNHTFDVAALREIDGLDFDDSQNYDEYWLASHFFNYRKNSSYYTLISFNILTINSQGRSTNGHSLLGNIEGTSSYDTITKGLRAVFKINNDVYVVGGNGSKQKPYILSKE